MTDEEIRLIEDRKKQREDLENDNKERRCQRIAEIQKRFEKYEKHKNNAYAYFQEEIGFETFRKA